MLKHCVAVLAVVALAITGAFAQGNGHGKGKGHGKGNSEAAEHGAGPQGIAFGEHDRDIIGHYFSNSSNLPPGLAKRGGNLPPGLQKQLDRNGMLPPGLQKRITPFPPELERQLPPLPSDYRRVVLGQAAIILDRRTQRIIDVIHNVTEPYATPR